MRSIFGRTDPWLVREAVAEIEAFLDKTMDVLETGAGGSTIWFAERARTVRTYEHSAEWAEKVQRIINDKKIVNIELIYYPEYVEEGVGDGGGRRYDLIMVDGRGRVQSVRTACGLLKQGGMFVLDNSERRRYREAVELLNSLGWRRRDFDAATKKRWRTTIWRS
jgi:predicted O-methyltransferase YrrM